LNDVILERGLVTNQRNKFGERLVNPDSSLAETVLFQPWFLPQHIAFTIRGLVPKHFWNKMRYFFDDYGCMICGTELRYHSNGMCRICYARIRKKMMLSVKRRSRSDSHHRLDLVLFRQTKLARKLLAGFSHGRKRHPKARRTEPERSNPVYEALSARLE
jgi:hypothetical protein